MKKAWTIGLLLISIAAPAMAMALKEYKYKCTKGGQIYTFSTAGSHKCPEHKNHTLIRVLD